MDHRDGDGLNNRRSNLRRATFEENGRNRCGNHISTSKYRGVFKHKNRWIAQIKYGRKSRHIGSFVDEIAAARAYDSVAFAVFGDFARLNFPGGK